ncbi:MAG: ROK family protein [Verrucomicrobia bacterium]|nr:ROK family protein [Verrucomicrobiota bacterium]
MAKKLSTTLPKVQPAKKTAKAVKAKKEKTAIKPAKTEKAPKLKSLPFWIGFDLGGTKMLACVLDKDYNVLGTARKSTGGSDGQINGRKKIINTIKEAITSAGVDPKGLQGIGIGCPGLVNPEKGILIDAPNLGWKNMGLTGILKKAFKKPVAVLNDVDAGTFGEYKLGAGKGARSLLGVFPGTGVGTGFVYEGKLIMGRTVSAMELGMIYLPGTHLGSAQHGAVMLEDLTSRLALASQAGIACYRGQLPELDKKTRGNLRDIRSKALANAFKTGEEAGMIMFSNSIRFLGMGVAAVVNLFAPDQITLGGGLVEEMPGLYVNLLREEVNRFALPALARSIKYSVAKLGGTAVAVGSVAWLREKPPTR